MPRANTRMLPPSYLKEIFHQLGLWDLIHNGMLDSMVIPRKTVSSRAYPNARSQIVVHHTAEGVHICTTHRIVDDNGLVLHWDEADLKEYGLTLGKSHAVQMS